jgi:hypothetical protein
VFLHGRASSCTVAARDPGHNRRPWPQSARGSSWYGATYTAAGHETWGTLAIGYGDGLPRALAAGGGMVIVRGRRVPIIGRVSMDMTMVDLTGAPEVQRGDVATIIGTDGAEEITVDEVAERCGTISYEILTRLSNRLPRVYLDGEHDVPVVASNTIPGATAPADEPRKRPTEPENID